MERGPIWVVLGVIVSVVIAWFLVDALFGLLWLIGKLVVVAIVAALVYFVLRAALRSSH